jgi:hypothetical protein
VFLTPLVLQAHKTPGLWIIYNDLVWEDPVFGRVVVPAKFITDLASTPNFMHVSPEFDPVGISRRPAAVHDFAYARGLGWTKEKSDQFLRASLIMEGASVELAEMFYQGVHLFGASSWAGDAGLLETADFVTPADYQAWWAGQMAPIIVTATGIDVPP